MLKSFNTNTENKDEWLTPKYVTDALGEFDLDPCSPGDRRPWDTAKNHIALPDDGLASDWFGRIWCNPPYGKETYLWLDKLSKHGNGVALIFARTDTKGFHRSVWDKADAVFFFKGRLRFHHVTGEPAPTTVNAPSCLVIYGEENVEIVSHSELQGKLIRITKPIPQLTFLSKEI